MGMHNEDDALGGLGFWVGSLASAMRKGLDAELSPFGITAAQWPILEMCDRGQANTLMQLARVIPVDPGAISRQVEKLVRKGLVRRRRQSHDRRSQRLDLTPAGRALVPELAAAVRANNAKFLAGMSRQEQQASIATIERMLRNAETAAALHSRHDEQ